MSFLHLSKCSASIFVATNACQKLCSRFVFTFSKLNTRSTIDPKELEKFDSKSDDWWNTKKFDGLRIFNSVRVPFIRDGILSISRANVNASKPLDGYSILDVGCGGGILSESLARLGAKVTGLDPGEHNVKVAANHSSKDSDIKENIMYVCDTIEHFATTDFANTFDAVVASEVVEHVNDVPTFVYSCVELTKSNGSLFFTTINKTYTSYLLSILIAENVIDLIPKGTHDWSKFVKPKDLIELLESRNCRIVSNLGTLYNPFTKKYSWVKNIDNMYSLHAVKL